MGLNRVGDAGVERDDFAPGSGGEGDHVHRGLHRLHRACELVAQDRIAGTVDQRAVEGHVGGAEGLVGEARLRLAVNFGAHRGQMIGLAAL